MKSYSEELREKNMLERIERCEEYIRNQPQIDRGHSQIAAGAANRITHLEIELSRATLALKAFVDWHDMDHENELACDLQAAYERAIEVAKDFVAERIGPRLGGEELRRAIEERITDLMRLAAQNGLDAHLLLSDAEVSYEEEVGDEG